MAITSLIMSSMVKRAVRLLSRNSSKRLSLRCIIRLKALCRVLKGEIEITGLTIKSFTSLIALLWLLIVLFSQMLFNFYKLAHINTGQVISCHGKSNASRLAVFEQYGLHYLKLVRADALSLTSVTPTGCPQMSYQQRFLTFTTYTFTGKNSNAGGSCGQCMFIT